MDKNESSGSVPVEIDSVGEHESSGTVPGEINSVEEGVSSGTIPVKIDCVDKDVTSSTVPGEIDSPEEDVCSGGIPRKGRSIFEDHSYGHSLEKSESFSKVVEDKENGPSPSMTNVDGSNANENEGIFLAGKRITDLDELEKLKAK